MKKTFIIILSILSFTNIWSQLKQDNSLKIQDLQLSNAPAFNLLDVSPSSIDNVASTKAFTTSVINAINQGNGIPQNYALEFTPFWFFKHSHYTSFKYFGIDTAQDAKSLPFSQARLLSVSFAIINKDSTTNNGKLQNHNAGLGIRTIIIQIQNADVRKNILRFSDNWYLSLKDFMRSFSPHIPTMQQLDSFEKAKINYGDSIKSYLQQKPLFSLGIAAASNMSFDSNTFKSNHISKTGIWIDANLSLCLKNKNKSTTMTSNYLNISALGRYISSRDSLNANKKYVNNNLFDYGIKVEFEFGKFSFAYEYIKRMSSRKTVMDTYKSVGLLHYKIKDGLFITGAFGQNFSSINNLITTIGLNWGLSSGEEKIDSEK